jgi:hypothetical protein
MKLLNNKNTNKVSTEKTIYLFGNPVKIKRYLSYNEWVATINAIAGFVFSGNGDTIDTYQPHNLEFARRYSIAYAYADLSSLKKEAELTVEDVWDILTRTDLIDEIIDFVGDDIFKIYDAADEAINARVIYLTNKTDLNALISKFTDKIDSFGQQFSNIDAAELLNVMKKFQGMSSDKIMDSIVRVAEGK